MAGSSNFLQWNNGAINQETDAEWAADAQRTGGAVDDSPLPSVTGNKLFYQVTTFVAAFGMMMAAKGYNVSDADINVLASVLANIITDADQLPLIQVLGFSPTPAFNAGAAQGFQMTLTGNVTASTIVGVLAGQLVAFYFIQDGVGGRTVSWPAGITGTVQPDPAPNAVSLLLFRADSTQTLRAAGPLVSSNGIFTGPLTAAALTLTAPGMAGQVLTNVGGSFVPRNPARAQGSATDYSGGGRSVDTTYQNNTGGVLYVSGSLETAGSSTGLIVLAIGATSALGMTAWRNTASATVSNGDAGFSAAVPAGWYYSLQNSSAVSPTIRSWVEVEIS